jgi:hypothetical protein
LLRRGGHGLVSGELNRQGRQGRQGRN